MSRLDLDDTEFVHRRKLVHSDRIGGQPIQLQQISRQCVCERSIIPSDILLRIFCSEFRYNYICNWWVKATHKTLVVCRIAARRMDSESGPVGTKVKP